MPDHSAAFPGHHAGLGNGNMAGWCWWGYLNPAVPPENGKILFSMGRI